MKSSPPSISSIKASAAGRSSSAQGSASIMWIWSGTPSGHGPSNSEVGRAPWKRIAPRAPGRVCVSDCAGITPSEKPAYTMSAGSSPAPARPRGNTAEREARVHDVGGQLLGRLRTAPDDLPEPDLSRVGDALVDGSERFAVEQVRRVDRVAGRPQPVGEFEEPGRLPLRGMEQEHRRHDDHCSQSTGTGSAIIPADRPDGSVPTSFRAMLGPAPRRAEEPGR